MLRIGKKKDERWMDARQMSSLFNRINEKYKGRNRERKRWEKVKG